MKIAVCDDMLEQRRILKEYLRRLEKEEYLEFDVCEFTSGEALLEYMKSGKHTPPDCLFWIDTCTSSTVLQPCAS